MKATYIHDKALVDSTFENDEGSLPQIDQQKDMFIPGWKERQIMTAFCFGEM